MLLSAAIIAYNEEHYLAGCLASLAGLADEVLVLLDARTRDASAAICAANAVRVAHEPWRGFPAQRNRAIDLCKGEWLLFVDADERVSPALAAEIRALLHGDPQADGYWIPRRNLFFGQALRGGGWHPDYQLRLLRRAAAHYDEARPVHEFAEFAGPDGRLHGHITHYNIDRVGELWHKQTSYALAEARTLQAAGQVARWRNFVGAPAREFWQRYWRLGGWRDGALGLFLCATMAWFALVRFAMLRLLNGNDLD